MARLFGDRDQMEVQSKLAGQEDYRSRPTRLEQYEAQKRVMLERIALLDQAIAALKSNPETERIINLLDAL